MDGIRQIMDFKALELGISIIKKETIDIYLFLIPRCSKNKIMKYIKITMLVRLRGQPFYKLVLYNVYLIGLTNDWSASSSMTAIFHA